MRECDGITVHIHTHTHTPMSCATNKRENWHFCCTNCTVILFFVAFDLIRILICIVWADCCPSIYGILFSHRIDHIDFYAWQLYVDKNVYRTTCTTYTRQFVRIEELQRIKPIQITVHRHPKIVQFRTSIKNGEINNIYFVFNAISTTTTIFYAILSSRQSNSDRSKTITELQLLIDRNCAHHTFPYICASRQ